MSASTVSITANPSARRRPVVVGDKKSGIELVATDGVAAATSDKISNGKDLSHSIRGEVVLERSRDVVQVKKALPNSDTALPSRRTNRKGVSKTQKPLWQTIISASTKNFLLLLVLLGLVQMIRRLLANPATISPITSSTEFERRIAEVEGLLVTTTKMMRVEVDLVDQKILNQIGGLRTELNKKIEDKGVELETGLKNLEDRTESLENSLGELKSTEWLSKEDFVKFLNEFKKAKGLDHGYTDLNLDEMRAFAREIVEKEFEKHSADGLGRVDYALASGGAMIVKHSEPYTVGKAGNWFYTANRNGVHNDAEKMLSPSFGEPGHCFPLKGSSGFVQIKLRTAIVPEAVTLEHVAKSVAYDRSKRSQGLQGFRMAAARA
ncbi:hypothetical protein HYC85_016350 [Camellia sinensis]|uniref:SUN domain-containing protein n=1 Tax=Camellia sinensis TaxID=4442 RepID=A0A7J7GZD8_CAMSI|nr:hypothetical protein HYC85_016350 [Camellia sinensis]